MDKNINKLEKLNRTKSYQDNQLISAVAQMETLPQKLFEIAVGAINPTGDANENRIVEIRRSLVESFLPKTGEIKNYQLEEVMRKLVKESVFSFETYTPTGRKKSITIAPISYIEVEENGDFIKLEFTDKILPLLTDLKRDYTRLNVQDIGNLSNTSNISIYKFLMKSYNKYENYKNKGSRTRGQLKEILNPEIYLDDLKRLTNTLGMYAKFSDFERRVLATAVDDINRSTNLDITYTKERIGRRIGKIVFHIRDKANLEINDLQNSGDDPKEITSRQEFAILFGSQILPFEMTQNEDALFELVPVLNRYKAFIEKYDALELTTHLMYVKKHMSGNPKNLNNYLITALQNYEQMITGKKQGNNQVKNQRQRKTTKRKLIQKETLPDWAKEGYVVPKMSEEETEALVRKEKELKERLARLTITNKLKKGVPLSENDIADVKKYGFDVDELAKEK